MGKLIKFNSADSHEEGHKRHRRKVCFAPKGEGPLCIEDAVLYIARVQGGLPGRNKGDMAILGKGPRAKSWGWQGCVLGMVTRDCT